MRVWPLLAAALLLAVPASAQREETQDRAAIHALLVAYGSTIDARDFDGFAALFAEDGTYGAGNGAGVPGKEAGEFLRRVFAENAQGFGEPNFYLFFNEVVTFTGADSAQASSFSLYMVPGEGGRPQAALMARYADELVREDGAWKFAHRRVESLMPAPGS